MPKRGWMESALRRQRLGTPAVVFFVVAAAAPLTVVAGAVSTAYSVTTFRGIPAAYVAVAVVLAIFAAGFVAMSRHVVNSGAFYSYIAQALGRPAGLSAAAVAVTAYWLMEIGLVGGFGAVAQAIIGVVGDVRVPWLVCALAAWLIITLVAVLRVDINGKVLAVLLIAEVMIAVLYDGVLLTHPADGRLDLSPLSLGHLAEPGGLAAMVGAIASFVGFEATVVFAEESKDPRRTVARATYLAIGITGLLYAVSAWAIPVATGIGQVKTAAQAHGTELMFDLVLPSLGHTLVDAGHLLFLTSLLAGGLAFHNIVARYLFALGREQVLPAGLGVASRTGAPRAGAMTASVVVLVALVVAAVVGADPAVHLLFWLTVVGGFGVVVLMAATSIAVVVFFHPRGFTENVWRRRLAPGLAAVLLTGVVVGSVMQFHILLGVDPDSPWRWAFPSLFAVAAVVGSGWALLLRTRRPAVYQRVGLGTRADFVNILDQPGNMRPAPGLTGGAWPSSYAQTTHPTPRAR